MQTIINNHFSSMLDKLLQKALKEKPEFINQERVNYECLFIDYDRKRDDIFITFPAYSKKQKEQLGHNINLTLHHIRKK